VAVRTITAVRGRIWNRGIAARVATGRKLGVLVVTTQTGWSERILVGGASIGGHLAGATALCGAGTAACTTAAGLSAAAGSWDAAGAWDAAISAEAVGRSTRAKVRDVRARATGADVAAVDWTVIRDASGIAGLAPQAALLRQPQDGELQVQKSVAHEETPVPSLE
jgi:hypothetical protein